MRTFIIYFTKEKKPFQILKCPKLGEKVSIRDTVEDITMGNYESFKEL